MRNGHLYFRQVAGRVIGAHLLCQRQKGLWKVFFKCDTHCCRLFTHACAFIYRMVPHHELSNVLWTVNFPNAVLRPSSTLTCKHMHTSTHHNQPHTIIIPLKSPFAGLLPQLYWGLRQQSAHIHLPGVGDEIICHKNPRCPFEVPCESSKAAVTDQSRRVPQYCLLAQLIKQCCRTC